MVNSSSCADSAPSGIFLRVRPGTSSRIAQLSQHEADGSEFEESESAAIEVLPVLGQSAATVQPSDGTFDNPTLGQWHEPFGMIGASDDFGFEVGQDFAQCSMED